MASAIRVRVTKVVQPGTVVEQVIPAMRRIGNAVGVRMQRLVPKDTWRLHDSIEPPVISRRGSAVVATVAVGGKVVDGEFVNYHLMVERGTSRMAAQPYMRPALLQTRSADLAFSGDMASKHGAAPERKAQAKLNRAASKIAKAKGGDS